jgi:hypothetical protein
VLPSRRLEFQARSIDRLLRICLASGPIVPPAGEVVVGGLAKQTNGKYFGGDAAGFALLPGSSPKSKLPLTSIDFLIMAR